MVLLLGKGSKSLERGKHAPPAAPPLYRERQSPAAWLGPASASMTFADVPISERHLRHRYVVCAGEQSTSYRGPAPLRL